MNPISYASKRIRQVIPPQILEVAYAKKANRYYSVPVSVDAVIKEQVIVDRVLEDCNLNSGTEVVISLNSCKHEYIQPGVHVYTVPKELTQHRNIITALSASFSNDMTGLVAQNWNTQDEVMNASKQQLNGMMSINTDSEARCTVIGDNIIMIEHVDMYLGRMYLRCVIEYDANMNQLNPRSWDNFATLCVWATKAHIYNENVVELDRGYMEGGSEIGQYRTIIEGYSDANETYNDYLNTTWAKVAVLNDPEMRKRMIRLSAGGYN